MTNRSQTGIDAWIAIGANGLLNRVSYAVYDCIYRHGQPMTRNEIDAGCTKTGKPNQAFSRRLVEMERRGVLIRKGTKRCPLKETTCTAWDINEGRLPIKLRKLPTPKGIIKELAATVYVNDDGNCIFCEVSAKRAQQDDHLETCLWRRAREALNLR